MPPNASSLVQTGPYEAPAFSSSLDDQPYLLATFQEDDVLESVRRRFGWLLCRRPAPQHRRAAC